MARIETIVANKLYVGYDYEGEFYYVINSETTTTRLTADEAYDIVTIIYPAGAGTTLKAKIEALATTTEEVTNIYYALEDSGIGIEAVWFNTYKDYAIMFDDAKIFIYNAGLVYPINKHTNKNKIINSMQYFYFGQLGLNVTLTDLSIIYDLLVSTFTEKKVFNGIEASTGTTPVWKYTYNLMTSGTARVNYTATINSTDSTVLLNVLDTDFPLLFPTGEFQLDTTTQLTNYLNNANTRVDNYIPVPTATNYSNVNTQVPSTTTITGLSKNLEFKGIYSDNFS